MKQCPSCRVGFTGDLDRCPLCGDELTGVASPSVFPKSEIAAPRKLAARMLLVMTLAVLALVISIGFAAKTAPLLVAAACVALIVNYIFVRNIIVHVSSMLRMIERYYLVLMALALICVAATGDTNVATFVIPVLSLIALLSNGVLVIMFRNAFVQGYAKYLLFDLALGIVPLVLLACGLVWWAPLAMASAVVAVLLLVVMLCFTGQQLVSELRKLFNT